MKLLLTLILAAASMLHAAPQAAKKTKGGLGDDAPAGKRTTYKQSAGKPREMEIYFPPNHDPAKANVPGVILFHGGSWSGGSLAQFRVACACFASGATIRNSDSSNPLLQQLARNAVLAHPTSGVRDFKAPSTPSN